MIEKEVWTYGTVPRRLSFQGTVQLINAFATYLPIRAERRTRLWHAMLAAVATLEVGTRPNRIEPRKLKKRNSKYWTVLRLRSSSAALWPLDVTKLAAGIAWSRQSRFPLAWPHRQCEPIEKWKLGRRSQPVEARSPQPRAAATVLNSPPAVEVSLLVVRT